MKQELFSSIKENKRKAAFIMVSIVFAFLLFNIFVWLLFYKNQIIALGISLFSFAYIAIAYVKPINIATAFLGAKKLENPRTMEGKMLLNIVDEMVIAGLLERRPDIYIIESEQANAFAVSRGNKAAIGVTSGLLKHLKREEIKAVIAHEVSHIMHGDSELKLISFVFAGSLLALSYIMFRLAYSSYLSSGSRRRKSGGLAFLFLIVGIVSLALGSFMALFMITAMSRKQETAADIEAVRLTRDKVSFISALEKIKVLSKNELNVPDSANALFFSPPKVKNILSKLTSTHPPIEERIKTIRSLA